jgi:hypothetical protein
MQFGIDSYLLSAGGVALGLTEGGTVEAPAEFERSRFAGLDPIIGAPFSPVPTNTIPAVFDTAPALASVQVGSVTFHAGRLYGFSVQIDRAVAPDLSAGSISFDHGGTTRTWTFVAQQAVTTSRQMAQYLYVAVVSETVNLVFRFPGAIGNS